MDKKEAQDLVKVLGCSFLLWNFANDNTYFMNIEGEVKQFVDEDNCPQVKNGLFMLLNKELNIKQKMPKPLLIKKERCSLKKRN